MMRLSLASLVCLLLVAPALAGAPALLDDLGGETFAGRACGTPPADRADMGRVEEALRRWSEERSIQGSKAAGIVQVAFHVLTAGGQGQVSDAQIAAQIEELNRAFEGTGYTFRLASVDRTDHPGWFRMMIGSGNERHAKQALARDPARRLNLYTCRPGALLLGWAHYPWSFPEDHYQHGVVIHHGTVPGGALERYNLGRTAVHEVGHYLGLLHTFENGCGEPGDFIADTPFEAEPGFGCPEGRNSCPDPDPDPIHNYMDYGDDPCVTEFTSGQGARMTSVVPVYRPGLFAARVVRADREIVADAADPSDLSRALEFRGAGPNPFRHETAVRFTLPRSGRVTLNVFDVSGQRVRTLIDASLPAGAHSALFAGRDLPAGLYFLHLEVGATRMTRSVILLR